MTTPINYVGTLPDGQELLVQIWPESDGGDGRITAATRPVSWATWGPPVTLEERQ